MRTLRVLHGVTIDGAHITRGTKPDGAHIIADYPDGFHIRCKQARWIERATKGAKKGEYRSVSATSDERRNLPDYWRSPQCGTYYDALILVVVDEPGAADHGHVSTRVLTFYDDPQKFRAFYRDFGSQLDDEQREMVARAERMSRRFNASSWQGVGNLLAELAAV